MRTYSLPETQSAVAELSSSRNVMLGMHSGNQIKTGLYGRVIADVPYNPEIHDPLMKNPLSIWEDITGEPHVSEVIPDRPLHLNVVLHRDPADKNLPEWLQPLRAQKDSLAHGLTSALAAASQPLDRTSLYIVGDSTPYSSGDRHAKFLPDTESSLAASNAISDICLKGLTFVVSDFRELLQSANDITLQNIVAVKTNHELEIKLPNIDRKVEWPTRGLGKVSLWKAAEVEKANSELDRVHGIIIESLEEQGVSVAQVVSGKQFIVANADRAIATAVREIDTV